MPVVNTANFVDRLRDITKRIDIRPSLQNVSKRWQNVYQSLAVGSPQQVQEFYKYIKVYKQCPENDILFMNMTVQLARASLFPNNIMFKQMLKYEKYMDSLIVSGGHHGIYGSRGMEILCGHNDNLLRHYRRYKRHAEIKNADKKKKISGRNAKQIAALKEVRVKARCQSHLENCRAPSQKSCQMLTPEEGPIPEKATKDHYPLQVPTPEFALVPEDVVVSELTEVKKYCEILKAQMEEAEKKREEDDVANKLVEVVDKLISTTNHSEESNEEHEETDKSADAENDEDQVNEEEEDEEDEDNEDDEDDEEELTIKQSESNFPDFQTCNITEQQKRAIMRILLGESVESEEKEEAVQETKIVESDDEEIEKIEENDIDAIEYVML